MIPNPLNKVSEFGVGEGLVFEEEIFQKTLKQNIGFSESYLWTQPQSLVVPNSWRRYEMFEPAVEKTQAEGWPVHTRRSGGGAVFHGPGVLNVSEISVRPSQVWSNESLYSEFCQKLISAISRLTDLVVGTGALPEAPCDGEFNILVNNRKLAGTALRRRCLRNKDILLAHACIWVSDDFAAPVRQITRLERRLNKKADYTQKALISLNEICNHSDAAASFAKEWAVDCQKSKLFFN